MCGTMARGSAKSRLPGQEEGVSDRKRPRPAGRKLPVRAPGVPRLEENFPGK